MSYEDENNFFAAYEPDDIVANPITYKDRRGKFVERGFTAKKSEQVDKIMAALNKRKHN